MFTPIPWIIAEAMMEQKINRQTEEIPAFMRRAKIIWRLYWCSRERKAWYAP